MRIVVERVEMKDEWTGGVLSIDGKEFCKTLEDTDRRLESGGEKVYARTAIPRGAYRVVLNHSNRFNKTLPLLVGVPQFKGIRIHAGNTDEDTEGCILVGEWRDGGYLHNSRATMAKLMNVLGKAIDDLDEVFLEVR